MTIHSNPQVILYKHTQKLSLSLSLTHTHTHTYTRICAHKHTMTIQLTFQAVSSSKWISESYQIQVSRVIIEIVMSQWCIAGQWP